MIAVLALEFRKQAPFLMLVLLLSVLGLGHVLMTELPHELSFFDYLPRSDHDPWTAGLLFGVLAMSLGSGLLMREFDEGTIEFLDGLPISRVGLFMAKVTVGLCILGLNPVIEFLFFAVLGWADRDSLNPHADTQWLALRLAGQLLLCFVLLGYALAVSYFRRFGWLLCVLCCWAVYGAVTANLGFEWLNPFSIVDFKEWGFGLRLDTAGAAFHASLASLCLAVVGWIFAAGRGEIERWSQRLARSAWGRRLSSAVGLAAVLAGVISAAWILVRVGDSGGDEELDDLARLESPDWTVVSREVPGFSASYHRGQRDLAEALLAAAPGVRLAVEGFLGQTLDGVVRLDLTGTRAHALGTTLWTHVRLDLTAIADLERGRAVLAHELAHACMNQGSDGRLRDRLFHEGLASFIEHELFDTGAREGLRRVAGFSWEWHGLSFATLVDAERLDRDWDADLVYPLGESFFAAVAEEAGRDGIRRLLTVTREDRAVSRLDGEVLWRLLFERAGIDLERVLDRWRARLVAAGRGFDVKPPAGTFARDENYAYVVLDPASFAHGAHLICRVRPRVGASALEYRYGALAQSDEAGAYFWFSQADLPLNDGWFQLGLWVDGWWLFGRWIPARP
ncbi:MAG: ABC transporter permease [Planctomycetota bacterium]